MNYAALAAEILNDPSSKGYSAFLPDSPGTVADLLNNKTESMVKSRMVTARAILAECPTGADILDRLEAASAVSSPVKWAVRFLGQEAGIDVGNSTTQSMIAQLVAGSVLTEDQGTNLRAMALQPASRAEVLGLGYVSIENIIKAQE